MRSERVSLDKINKIFLSPIRWFYVMLAAIRSYFSPSYEMRILHQRREERKKNIKYLRGNIFFCTRKFHLFSSSNGWKDERENEKICFLWNLCNFEITISCYFSHMNFAVIVGKLFKFDTYVGSLSENL